MYAVLSVNNDVETIFEETDLYFNLWTDVLYHLIHVPLFDKLNYSS